MSNWRERVEVERKELNEKVQKLSDFINDREKFEALPKRQQALLQRQESAMKTYLGILDQLIRLPEE